MYGRNGPIDIADAKKPGISRLPHHTHVLLKDHPAERISRPAEPSNVPIADLYLGFFMYWKKSLLGSSTSTSPLLEKLSR